MSKSDFRIGTKALLYVSREQAIRTNYVKHHIDKTSTRTLCRLCGKKGESVQHLVSGYEKLTQKDHNRQHDSVAKEIHWDLCRKSWLEHTEKCYENRRSSRKWRSKSVVGYQCSVWQRDRGKKTRHNCNWQKERKGIIINIAVPADHLM